MFDDEDDYQEWPDRDLVMARLEKWDGAKVDDIMRDIRELVRNGTDEDLMDAEGMLLGLS
jgi:hypothetical protein